MKERKILFTAHSKLITRCLPFLLSFVFMFIPALNVDAAASSYRTLFAHHGNYNDSQSQSVTLSFTSSSSDVNLLNSDGGHITGYIAETNDYYQVVHITQRFAAIGYFTFGEHSFDAFQLEAIDPNRKITVSSSLPFTCSISNVKSYLLLSASGNDYQSNLDYANFYIDMPITGSFTLLPCVEYDVIISFSEKDVNSNSYSICNITSIYSGTPGVYYDTYGINYTSSGESGIIGAINNLLNGYQSNNVGQAESSFNTGAGDLTSIEDDLTDSSSTMVDTFTAEGFDTSLLDSVAPSMQYLVTWFTNFWNIGGALTKCFTLCFALFIAFYILRVRS